MTNSKTTDVGGIPAKDNVLIISLKQLHSENSCIVPITILHNSGASRSLALFFSPAQRLDGPAGGRSYRLPDLYMLAAAAYSWVLVGRLQAHILRLRPGLVNAEALCCPIANDKAIKKSFFMFAAWVE